MKKTGVIFRPEENHGHTKPSKTLGETRATLSMAILWLDHWKDLIMGQRKKDQNNLTGEERERIKKLSLKDAAMFKVNLNPFSKDTEAYRHYNEFNPFQKWRTRAQHELSKDSRQIELSLQDGSSLDQVNSSTMPPPE